MLRVLISTSTFPLRDDDGLPRFVADLAETLAAHCRVTVLAPGAPGAAARERRDGLEVRRFTYFLPRRFQALAYRSGIGDNLAGSWLVAAQLPVFLARQIGATRALVRELGIDVVNSQWILPQGLSSAVARAAGARFRHVLTLHGGDLHALRRLPFGAALARWVIARTDVVFAVSSEVKRDLDELLGRDSAARVQPVGVHAARFEAVAGSVAAASRFPEGYLLYVGRLVPIKGVGHLLHAFARLAPEHPGLGLVIAGYGPEEAALRSEVLRLGLAGAVEFRGAQPHAEIARLLRGCRAAVVSSIVEPGGRTEGMPAVVLEALAAGARLVATAVGGIPDLIRHGENGWLCRDRDPDALAAQIRAALADPADSALVQRARETAARYDWTAVAERYREAFGEEPARASP